MALQSSKVAAGIKILAAHFNALWTDLVVNHDHSTGMGGTVDHADLSESGAMGGITYAHSDIDDHIDAGQGVHGLNAAAYVAGSYPQVVVVPGSKASPGTSGTCYFSNDGLAPADITLSTVIAIILTCKGPTGDETHHNDIPEWIDCNPGAGTFTYQIDHDGGASALSLSFLVVGTK